MFPFSEEEIRSLVGQKVVSVVTTEKFDRPHDVDGRIKYRWLVMTFENGKVLDVYCDDTGTIVLE